MKEVYKQIDYAGYLLVKQPEAMTYDDLAALPSPILLVSLLFFVNQWMMGIRQPGACYRVGWGLYRQQERHNKN